MGFSLAGKEAWKQDSTMTAIPQMWHLSIIYRSIRCCSREKLTNLFIHYLSCLVGLSFTKSFGLFAPLHQRVMKKGLKHTEKELNKLKAENENSEYLKLDFFLREQTRFHKIILESWRVHLMSGSLWSVINLRVTSQACLKRPSVPMGPMAWTMFWVRRKGTTSGTSNVSP